MPALVPGAHVLIASNPLVSHVVADAMDDVGMERRGTVVRMVRTMRGGDRPKGAHEEYPEVSVIPKALYEPWLLFRKPLDGTIKNNLERWWTGGLRRPDSERPFEEHHHLGPRAGAGAGGRAPLVAQAPGVPASGGAGDPPLPLGKGTLLDTYAGVRLDPGRRRRPRLPRGGGGAQPGRGGDGEHRYPRPPGDVADEWKRQRQRQQETETFGPVGAAVG